MNDIISSTHSVSLIFKKAKQVDREIYLAEGHDCPVEPLLKVHNIQSQVIVF